MIKKKSKRFEKKLNTKERYMQDRLGVWDGHVHTAVFKIDNQQVLKLYSTGNSAQCFVIT